MTGLSAQTVSVIMRELEEEGLLLRQEPMRGKIGQPSIPMALNPDGAYFLGLKIGRRSAELVLIDFLGNGARDAASMSYRYPTPRETVEFVTDRHRSASAPDSPPAQDKRIAGLGIAMPFELWNWADTAGAPRRRHGPMAPSRHPRRHPGAVRFSGLSAERRHLGLRRRTGVRPARARLRDFIYFYIGAFAGGGIVLNGGLYGGSTGNAGALGSMPVPGPDGKPTPADRHRLDRHAGKGAERQAVVDASHLWTSPQDWGDLGAELDDWIASAAACAGLRDRRGLRRSSISRRR